MGIDYNTDDHLTYINVSVANTAGGTAMDLSQMLISYSDSRGNRLTSIPLNSGGINSCGWTHAGDTNIMIWDAAYPEDVHWCVSQKLNDRNPSSPNDMLEPGEVWVLSIEFPYPGTPDTRFTMYFQPSVGAPLSISRGLPGAFTKIQPLR
jgi:archaeal flagellin FlaB